MHSEFDPPSHALGSRTRRGLLDIGVSQGLRLGIQFASVIILANLLSPSDFGVMAMAAPFFGIVVLLQDLGLFQTAIQRFRITHDELSGLFWVGLASGLVCSVLLLACAPLVGRFFQDERVAWLTAAMAVFPLINAAGAIHSAILTRRMHFRGLAFLEVVTAATSFGVAALCTFAARNFWSLYVGQVVAALVSLTGVWLICRWRPAAPRLGLVNSALLRSGLHLTGASAASLLGRSLDSVLMGRFWGDIPLGLYDRSLRLLLFPLQQVTQPLSRTAIPALSRLVGDPPRYQAAFLRVTNHMLFLAVPGIVFLIVMAPEGIRLLLGAKWQAIIPIFQVLGWVALIQVVNTPASWLFLTLGRSRELLIWNTFAAVTNIAGFVIGLPFGPVGLAAGYAVTEALRTPLLWLFVTRRGPVSQDDALRLAIPHLIIIAVCYFALVGMAELATLHPVVNLVCAAILSYATGAAAAFALPGTRAQAKDLAKLAERFLTTMASRMRIGPDRTAVVEPVAGPDLSKDVP